MDVDLADICATTFRYDGVWTDCRIFSRDVPRQDSLYVHVIALSHWKWGFRRVDARYCYVFSKSSKRCPNTQFLLSGIDLSNPDCERLLCDWVVVYKGAKWQRNRGAK